MTGAGGAARVWHLERAWLGGAGVDADVVVTVRDGRVVDVANGPPPAGAERLHGLVLPGLANTHSHAFHRALRGASQAGSGDFWTWRRAMYGVADVLDPDSYLGLATAVYAEMALAGVTAVGEFHYLHHGRGGRPYADANEMGHALVRAAAAAGIRLTLLDTLYLRAGFGDDALDPVQERFSDGDAGRWAERAGAMAEVHRDSRHAVIGAAAHSVRAVTAADITVAGDWARSRSAPFHLHLSEQVAENEACVDATGATPTALVDAAGALGPATVAVHATHLTDDGVTRLGAAGAGVCLCPTTERDLGDGIGRGSDLTAAGCRLSLGSDSHAVVDLFEEARAVDLDERLVTGRRGLHEPAALLDAATTNGYCALGIDGGRIAPGMVADFVAVSPQSTRLAGITDHEAAAHLVFAAQAADVSDVVVGGEWVVRERVHVAVPDVVGALDRAVRDVLA